jgi:1-acyl-sn-glycerol-3-phosphate acyltransferase
MYDIPLLIWYLRRYHPKFIAKAELGKGIPSISFALRNMGSVLIDRGNQRQALPAIQRFGTEMQDKRYAAVIFPEGTRARDGRMKNFKPGGLVALMESMPEALIVPIAIEGSWEMLRWNFLPVPFGVRLGVSVLKTIPREAKDPRQIVEETESAIRAHMGQLDGKIAETVNLAAAE